MYSYILRVFTQIARVITNNVGEEQSAVSLIVADADRREGHLHEDEHRVADISARLRDGDRQVVVCVRNASRWSCGAAAVRQIRVRNAESIADREEHSNRKPKTCCLGLQMKYVINLVEVLQNGIVKEL